MIGLSGEKDCKTCPNCKSEVRIDIFGTSNYQCSYCFKQICNNCCLHKLGIELIPYTLNSLGNEYHFCSTDCAANYLNKHPQLNDLINESSVKELYELIKVEMKKSQTKHT